MCARAKDIRLGLQHARDSQDQPPALRVLPTFDKVRQNPTRTFDSVDILHNQTGRRDLVAQLVGPVEIRCREKIGAIGVVPMLTVAEIALDDSRESLVDEQLARQTIERGSEARNSCCQEHATGLENPASLSQCGPTVLRINEMIERTEHQYCCR